MEEGSGAGGGASTWVGGHLSGGRVRGIWASWKCRLREGLPALRPANGKKSNPFPPIPKSSYFDIHPTPNQKYYKEVKPNPSNNIIDPKPTRNWVETHGKSVGLAYCLTSYQLHTLIHSDNFIDSFSDIKNIVTYTLIVFWHSTKSFFAECQKYNTRQRALCRVLFSNTRQRQFKNHILKQ
jgi:hypothetical protein